MNGKTSLSCHTIDSFFKNIGYLQNDFRADTLKRKDLAESVVLKLHPYLHFHSFFVPRETASIFNGVLQPKREHVASIHLKYRNPYTKR